MKTKLTIITTTYNQEKYIKSALDGFVMQKTNFPFIAYISDDCSTDSTVKILKKYAKKYPDIIKPKFNKKNVGPMDNFINTLSLAETEYVALCDGDDYWTDSEKLQKQVDFLDHHKDYSVCFHKTNIFFEDKSKPEEIYPKDFKETSTLDDLLKESFIPANTVVYRWRFNKKENLKDIFPQNIVPGDYYIHLLHAEKGKIGFINEVMSCYRRHAGGMWWLTSQINGQDEFNLKYGSKYISFFENVEQHFNLSPDTFDSQKSYLAHNTIRCYLSKNNFQALVDFKKAHNDLYEKHINDFNYLSSYQEFSKFKKAIYLMLTDNKLFKHKIKEKISAFKHKFK